MQVQIALLPNGLPKDWNAAESIAVVIDTLRFTTTACQALTQGALCVEVAAKVEAARTMATEARYSNDDRPALLCGERHCKVIEGFDLGNSPLEYRPEIVLGKRLVFTTTNGTLAVTAAQPAAQIWLGAMVNRRAIVDALLAEPPASVWIVCAGTDGSVALEDVLTAGAIASEVASRSAAVEILGDSAHLALAAWRHVASESESREMKGSELTTRLLQAFEKASGGRNLIQTGFADDLHFAAQVDVLDAVPKTKHAWDRFELDGDGC